MGIKKERIEELEDYQREIEAEEIEQYNKDQLFLEELEKKVTPEYFLEIKCNLIESENTMNYRYIEEPIGDKQNEGDYFIWVRQSCGVSGDDYHGTVCMKIKAKRYFIWDYWM